MGALTSNPASYNFVGHSQAIRSDEWIRNTPQALGFDNNINDTGQSVLSASFKQGLASTRSWLNFPNVLVTFLPQDSYFACIFWFPIFLTLLVIPKFLEFLNVPLRYGIWATTALIMSPSSAWWSFLPIEAISRFFLIVILMLSLLRLNSRKSLKKYLSLSLGLGYAIPFALFPYQPSMICLAVMFSPFILTQLWKFRKTFKNLVTGLVIGFGLFAAHFAQNAQVYSTMANTIYPGRRRSNGGALNAIHWLFTGPYDFTLLGNTKLAPFTNLSEISIGYVFLLGPAIYFGIKRKLFFKSNEFIALSSGLLILVLWSIFPIPGSGFNPLKFVPPARAIMLWSTLVPIYVVIAKFIEPTTAARKIYRISNIFTKLNSKYLDVTKYVIIFLSVSLSAYSALWLIEVEYSKLSFTWAILFCTQIFILFLLLSKVPKKFNIGLLILSLTLIISSGPINPWVFGTSAYTNNPISKYLRGTSKNTIYVTNSAFIDAVVMATGRTQLSGQQTYGPNKAMWRILDPKNKSEAIWNRGASFITFDFVELNAPKILLLGADTVRVLLNPCSPEIKTLKIGGLISTRPLIGFDQCLTMNSLQREFAPAGFYVYTVHS